MNKKQRCFNVESNGKACAVEVVESLLMYCYLVLQELSNRFLLPGRDMAAV